MPSTQPERVLRIGIVRDGRIVEERLMKPHQAVTVGESTRNDFLFPPSHLPARFQLFKPTRGGYVLRLSAEMEGKVSLGDAVRPLEELRRGQARKAGATWELPLAPKSRGKIVIDGVTVLFQFVPAPPEPARAVTSFRPRLWEEDDPVYFGFLGLNSAFAALAMVFVYTRPPGDPFAVPEIPERLIARLYVEPAEPPAVEEPAPLVDPDGTPQPREVADRVEEPAEPAPGEPREPRPTRDRVDDAVRNSAMARALGIGTTGENNNGRTIEDHLDGGGTLYSDLDAFVNDGEQLVLYEEGPRIRTSSMGPSGNRDVDIGVLDEAEVDEVVMTQGPANQGPTGTFTLGPPEDPKLTQSSVASVIKAHGAQLKACYESERKLNPSTGGRMVVWFEIDGSGQVSEVTVLDNQTGSNGAFESCVTRRFGRWTFAAEDAGVHTFPLVFTPT